MASFKVLHVPVTSFEDATHNAEQLNQLFAAPGALTPFLQLVSAQKSRSFTGQQLTWPAATAFSNATTLSLSGATGNVFAVVTGGNVTNPAFFDVPVFTAAPNGAGGVAIAAKTANGAAPGAAGVCTFQALVWGS